MKVNVLTIDDVKIGKFSWWSKWIDIAVYNYGSNSYLIQMGISRTNKKKFRSVKLTGSNPLQMHTTTAGEVGDLTQMNSRKVQK